jgi:hypothetical protein
VPNNLPKVELQDKQVKAQHKHMVGTKPTHAKGQATFNVNKLSKSYRKEAHWI